MSSQTEETVNCTESCAGELKQLQQDKRYIAITAFQLMVVTVGAIMFIELWNKLRPISDTRKSEDDDSDTVNIVQLRIQHEIEKQNLITQLGHQKKRNAHLIDSNVNYISDLDSKSEKLTIAGTDFTAVNFLLKTTRNQLSR